MTRHLRAITIINLLDAIVLKTKQNNPNRLKIIYAWDLDSLLVMLRTPVSKDKDRGRWGDKRRQTYKSKKENWLGLLPYSYTKRLAR